MFDWVLNAPVCVCLYEDRLPGDPDHFFSLRKYP